MTVRLRRLAWINPTAPGFEQLSDDQPLTFLPLEAVWADDRLDITRSQTKDAVKSGYVRFQEDDVLLPKTAPTFEHGRTAVAAGLINGAGAGSSELHVLRARPGNASRYLAYVLRSADFLAQGVGAYEGVAGLKRVPPEFVADWPVAELDGDQQRRIADFLDERIALLDRTIKLRLQQIDLTRELTVAQIDELLRQGGRPAAELLPAEYQPFGLVPRSWKQGRLRSTSVEVQTGPFGSQLNAGEYVHGGWPVVNPSNITREGSLIADDSVTVDDRTRARLARHVLQVGDVVFGRRGDLGRAGLVTEEHAGWVCGTGSLRVRFLEAAFDPAYLTRFLRLPAIRHYFESNSVGSTMQNLNTSLLLGMPLLIPALDEQRSIAERADALALRSEGLARLLTQSIDLLREHKRALITAAVSGGIDVTTARPAEVA